MRDAALHTVAGGELWGEQVDDGVVLNAKILLGQALSLDTPLLILAKLALEVKDHASVACTMLNDMQSLVEDGG